MKCQIHNKWMQLVGDVDHQKTQKYTEAMSVQTWPQNNIKTSYLSPILFSNICFSFYFFCIFVCEKAMVILFLRFWLPVSIYFIRSSTITEQSNSFKSYSKSMVLVSEVCYFVQEASTLFSTSHLCDQARGVNNQTKQKWCRESWKKTM